MTRYHLSLDGPKECDAETLEACPYARAGGEHFSDWDEAKRRHESLNSSKNIKTVGNQRLSMELTPATQHIATKLTDAGFRTLIVGGSVRDAILGFPSKDIDFEVYGAKDDGSSLTLDDLSTAFTTEKGLSFDQAGASFAVLKARYKGEDFDIALPRTEVSTGDGHKEYETAHDSTMTFEEASSRRDFTINAMGYDAASGRLVDPHNGRADLKAKVLRHVGPAFADDPLRAMRAVNFASRFGFQIAPETQELCRSLAPHATTLSTERIEEEFNKVFTKGRYCDRGLAMLHDIGWNEKLEGFRNCSREELDSFGAAMNRIRPGRLRKAYLAHVISSQGKGNVVPVIESASKERAFIRSFSTLVTASNEADQGDLIAARRTALGPESWNHVVKAVGLAGGDEKRLRELPEPVPSAVTGKLLVERGVKPGPDMGKPFGSVNEFKITRALTMLRNFFEE